MKARPTEGFKVKREKGKVASKAIGNSMDETSDLKRTNSRKRRGKAPIAKGGCFFFGWVVRQQGTSRRRKCRLQKKDNQKLRDGGESDLLKGGGKDSWGE